jgi:hypothetical protein
VTGLQGNDPKYYLAITVSKADFWMRMERAIPSSIPLRTQSSATCGTCASRFRNQLSLAFHSISPNGAPAIRRAIPCTTPTSAAPYILKKLKASQGLVQGMSYWTYTDLFEGPGPPTAPFQGGFGLLNPQGIRKPAYFAYKYLHALDGYSLATNDPQAMLSAKDGNVTAVIWDFEQPDQKVSNRSFYTKVIPSHPAAPVHLRLP